MGWDMRFIVVMVVVVMIVTTAEGLSGSKLSIHSGWGELSAQIVQQAQPRLIKLLDNFGSASTIKSQGSHFLSFSVTVDRNWLSTPHVARTGTEYAHCSSGNSDCWSNLFESTTNLWRPQPNRVPVVESGAADYPGESSCGLLGRCVFCVVLAYYERVLPRSLVRSAFLVVCLRGSSVFLRSSVGYNEPAIGSVQQMEWLATFDATRVEILNAAGRKAVIGCFSTGTPDVTTPAIIEAYYPAIDAAIKNGGVLGEFIVETVCTACISILWVRG